MLPMKPAMSTSGVAMSTEVKGCPAKALNSSMKAPKRRKHAIAADPME
jgi:hypothetical protein